MKKFLILLACLLIYTGCRGKEDTHRVILPDPSVMGKGINKSFALFNEKSTFLEKYPVQVVIDAEHGQIKGIKAVYGKAFSFSDVELEIDELYGRWKVSKNDDPTMSLWRVTPRKIGIQLSLNEKGLVQVIILPFLKE